MAYRRQARPDAKVILGTQPIGREDSRDQPGHPCSRDPSCGQGHAPAGEPAHGGEQGYADDRGGAHAPIVQAIARRWAIR